MIFTIPCEYTPM